MTFMVGMKVLCISEWDNDSYLDCTTPSLNQIYTIRDLQDGGIRFFEIRNGPQNVQDTFTGICSFEEPSFWQCNFRPLVERKSKISFIEGAPLDSEKFDNRKKQKERV